MENTILQQGRFTGVAGKTRLAIRSDLDWMKVYNNTNIAAGDEGLQYYWQRGMADRTGYVWTRTAVTGALTLTALASPYGFHLVDTSVGGFGVSYPVTTSAAAAPVITYTGGVGAVPTGSIVKLDSVANAGVYQNGLDTYEFQVTWDNAGQNTITYATPTVQTAGTSGNVREVTYDPIYYPKQYFIIDMAASGTSTLISFSADSSLTVGQKVRFQLPAEFGAGWKSAFDNIEFTITDTFATNPAICTTPNMLLVDYDSTGIAAFAFPVGVGITKPAKVIPIGQNTATSLILGANILGDATHNTSIIGMDLITGASYPGGSVGDIMYWIAGKSFSVTNS